MARTKGFLRASVDAGADNERDDVIGVKRLLQELGLYDPGSDTDDTIDKAFDQAIRSFQEQAGLRVDGTINPGGETERNLLALRTGEGFEPPPGADDLKIGNGVGAGGANDIGDVALMKRAFGALGTYRYDRTRPPPPYIDTKLVAAIRKFQRDQGLFDDGLINPDGETMVAVRHAMLAAQENSSGSANPTPDAANDQHANALQILLQLGKLGARKPPKEILKELGGKGAAAGAGAAGAAGTKKALDAANDNDKADRDIADPLPPNPPFPANPPKMPDRTEFPADAPDLPEITGSPAEDEANGWVEVFPDQREEIELPLIIERRGKEPVRSMNAQVRGLAEKYSDRFGYTARHTGGARDRRGREVPETYFPNYDTGGRRGSSYADIAFTSKKTGRQLLINTVDTLVDGSSPDSREHRAAVKMRRNAKSGDIVVLIGKLRPGEQLDEESLEKFLGPLLEELDRPAEEYDHRSSETPEKDLRIYRKAN